jgi:hypothetical protein
MRPTSASTSNYLDTTYNPSVVGSLNDAHLSVYTRTNSAVSSVIMGSFNTATFHQINASTTSNSGNIALNVNAAGPLLYTGITDTRGFWLGNRLTSTLARGLLNGRLNRINTTATVAIPNLNIFLGARNRGGSRDNPSSQEISFASAGKSLTIEQERIYYLLIQMLQINLNRQV